MSAGQLTNGNLWLNNLFVGGQPITAGTTSGVTSLHDSASGVTTSATPVLSVGTVTTTSAANSLAFTATSGGVALGGNIQVTGGGGGGIPSLTTNPTTGGTGNGAVIFSAGVTTTAGPATAVWTGSTGEMALSLNIPPASGGVAQPTAYNVVLPAADGTVGQVLAIASINTTPSPPVATLSWNAPGGGGIGPIAWGILKPGQTVGGQTIPAWGGTGNANTLTVNNAQLAASVLGGTLPAQSAIYANSVWMSSWQLGVSAATNPQGALAGPLYGAAGSSPTTYVWSSYGAPNGHCVSWALWSAGTST